MFVVTVDGGWGDWELDGPCSVTCGNGIQKLRRKCDEPEPKCYGKNCDGIDSKTVACNKELCPGKVGFHTYVTFFLVDIILCINNTAIVIKNIIIIL